MSKMIFNAKTGELKTKKKEDGPFDISWEAAKHYLAKKSKIPIDFKESNTYLTKPSDMTDEECGGLPTYTDGIQCISCWKPTLRERLSLLVFGKLWLWVRSGDTQPPVAIEIRKDNFNVG